jgi:hypothetical protein
MITAHALLQKRLNANPINLNRNFENMEKIFVGIKLVDRFGLASFIINDIFFYKFQTGTSTIVNQVVGG